MREVNRAAKQRGSQRSENGDCCCTLILIRYNHKHWAGDYCYLFSVCAYT